MPAAVPQYVPEKEIAQAPPGHRFKLYFEGWGQDFLRPTEGKARALFAMTNLPDGTRADLAALLARQEHLAVALDPRVHVMDATSIAPFVTGVGQEHPLENGFAFADPYGLPVLPGSSIKGVLRRAAEELALFEPDPRGWTLAAVWWLFGFDATSCYLRGAPTKGDGPAEIERRAWCEAYARHVDAVDPAAVAPLLRELPASARESFARAPAAFLRNQLPELAGSLHTRGCLDCWDVLPDVRRHGLRVEIMNPHFGHHYKDKDPEPPHDAGSPNPVFYLALPADTPFRFFVHLAPTGGMPDSLHDRWRDLVEAATAHAFNWLGFGAKGAQGFGLMRVDRAKAEAKRLEHEKAVAAERVKREEDARMTRLASLSPLARCLEALSAAVSEDEVHAAFNQLDTFQGDDQKRLATSLKQAFLKFKLLPPKNKKGEKKAARLTEILGA